MPKHIHATDLGVDIEVTYIDDAGDFTFTSAFVLGGDYRPTGPNILAFLHSVWHVPNPSHPSPDAITYLSRIQQEIRSGNVASRALSSG